MSAPLRRRIHLSTSGLDAAWEPDPLREGAWVLTVGGAEQSTLFPDRPRRLVYEYLARTAHVLDAAVAARASAEPVRVVHLGGGALSLPRYVEEVHPGSRQVVVDLDAKLMPFVLESFPLQRPDLTRLVIGDVRDALPEASGAGPADAVVLDIALGADSPQRLREVGFARELLAATLPDGVVLVNVGDDPGLPGTRELVGAFRAAGASVFITAPAAMLAGDEEGNVVLVASRRPWSAQRLEEVRAAGPHPAALVAGLDLDGLGL